MKLFFYNNNKTQTNYTLFCVFTQNTYSTLCLNCKKNISFVSNILNQKTTYESKNELQVYFRYCKK